MIPATYPCAADGSWKVYIVSATGRTKWKSYIPVLNVDGDTYWAQTETGGSYLGGDTLTDEADSVVWTNNSAGVGQTSRSGYTGGGHYKYNGAGQYMIRAKGGMDFSGDFTMEVRFVPLLATGYQGLVGGRENIPGTEGFSLLSTNSSNVLALSANVNASYEDNWMAASVAPTTTDWNHVVVQRSGNDFTLYLNGVLEDSRTQSGTFLTSSNIALGLPFSNSVTFPFGGDIDWFRFTAAARYSSTPTPPTTDPLTSGGGVAANKRNRLAQDGAIDVTLLTDVTGLVEGVDYTPVVEVGTNRWIADDDGYIAIRPV